MHRDPVVGYYSKSGFSLLEILVALVILSVLSILMIMGFQGTVVRGEITRCMSNLRSSGAAMYAYIGDSENRIRGFYGGTYMEGLIWSRVMHERGYVIEEDLLRCPTGELSYLHDQSKRHLWYWQTYGMNMMTTSSPGRVISQTSPSGGTGRVHEINMSAIERPDLYILLADSTNPSTYPKQVFRMTPASKDGIHLRHSERACLFFLDGRVENLNQEEIADLQTKAQLSGYRSLPVYP